MSPQVSWEELISSSQEHLTVNPTRILDRKNIKNTEFKAIIYALEALEGLDNRLYESESSKHMYFTFLVGYDSEFIAKIKYNFDLDLKIKECSKDLFLMTSSLFNWKSLTVKFSTKKSPEPITLFANFVTLYFDKLGLRAYWDDYQRKIYKNELFTLEKK